MNINQFMESHPSHPLSDMLNLMSLQEDYESEQHWSAMCCGAAWMLKHYGELTPEQTKALIADIKGKGATIQ